MNTLFRPEVMRSRKAGALVGQLRLPPKRNQVLCAVGAVLCAAALVVAASTFEHTHVMTTSGVIGEQYECPNRNERSAHENSPTKGRQHRVGPEAAASIAVPVCVWVRVNAPFRETVRSGMTVRVRDVQRATDELTDGVIVFHQAAEQIGPQPTGTRDVDIGIVFERHIYAEEKRNRVDVLPSGRAVDVHVSVRRMTLLDWLLKSLDATTGSLEAVVVESDGRSAA